MDERVVADRQLLARIARRDRAAFEQLYDRYAAMALGVAMATLANRPHSEAIVAEAFWLVWRRAASIDAQTPRAEQWLGGLVHYLVVQRRSQIIPH